MIFLERRLLWLQRFTIKQLQDFGDGRTGLVVKGYHYFPIQSCDGKWRKLSVRNPKTRQNMPLSVEDIWCIEGIFPDKPCTVFITETVVAQQYHIGDQIRVRYNQKAS